MVNRAGRWSGREVSGPSVGHRLPWGCCGSLGTLWCREDRSPQLAAPAFEVWLKFRNRFLAWRAGEQGRTGDDERSFLGPRALCSWFRACCPDTSTIPSALPADLHEKTLPAPTRGTVSFVVKPVAVPTARRPDKFRLRRAVV